MTVFMKDRQPIHQARKYDPSANTYESSAASLSAWIEGATGMETSVTADSQGFSFTYTSDGTYTKTGGTGDWIVLVGGSDPEVFDDATFQGRFVVIP
jgi:hypothetical protein